MPGTIILPAREKSIVAILKIKVSSVIATHDGNVFFLDSKHHQSTEHSYTALILKMILITPRTVLSCFEDAFWSLNGQRLNEVLQQKIKESVVSPFELEEQCVLREA